MAEGNPWPSMESGQRRTPIDLDRRDGLAPLRPDFGYAPEAGADRSDFAPDNDGLFASALTISNLRRVLVPGLPGTNRKLRRRRPSSIVPAGRRPPLRPLDLFRPHARPR